MSAEPLPTPEDVLERTFREHAGTVELDQDEAPWEVEDRGAAAWCVQKIRQAHQTFDADTFELRTAIDALRAEADRLQAEVDARAKRRDHEVGFFTAKLTGWLRRLHAEDPKTKSVKLPGGTVKSRAGRDQVEYIDERDITAYADEHGLDFAEWVPKVSKSALIKHIKSTGEVPTGAEFVPATEDDRSYTVEVEGVES